jgi:hypothetical protein
MKPIEFLTGRPPASWLAVSPASVRSVRALDGAVYTLHAVPPSVVSLPARLLVLRGTDGFVAESPGASSAAIDRAAAMPVLAYRVDDSFVLHVPCGAFDAPGVWTFLAPDMRYVGAPFESAPRWSSSALA